MKRQNISHSLNLLSLQLSEFETYLLSKELFWPLSHVPGQSRSSLRLTTGNLLLNINEISIRLDDLSSQEKQEFIDLMTDWDRLQRKWLSNLQNKSLQELGSRINQWQAYLTDLEKKKDPGDNYQVEVRSRVICALLSDLVQDQPDIKPAQLQLKKLDKRLQRLFVSGPFLWSSSLQELYPDDEYWFLYGKPSRELHGNQDIR